MARTKQTARLIHPGPPPRAQLGIPCIPNSIESGGLGQVLTAGLGECSELGQLDATMKSTEAATTDSKQGAMHTSTSSGSAAAAAAASLNGSGTAAAASATSGSSTVAAGTPSVASASASGSTTASQSAAAAPNPFGLSSPLDLPGANVTFMLFPPCVTTVNTFDALVQLHLERQLLQVKIHNPKQNYKPEKIKQCAFHEARGGMTSFTTKDGVLTGITFTSSQRQIDCKSLLSQTQFSYQLCLQCAVRFRRCCLLHTFVLPAHVC